MIVDDTIFADQARKVNMAVRIVVPAEKLMDILEREDLPRQRAIPLLAT